MHDSIDEVIAAENTFQAHQAKLYTKISNLRTMSLKCDWTKDKRMLTGSTSYPYLSAGKVKQNFAPLFTKAGLEVRFVYGQPRQLDLIETRNSRMQHWIIDLQVKFVDIETGLISEPMVYWGEGTDVLDKGLRKAMTAAVKSWLSDMFFLEEGIDPEISGSDEATFTPKANEPEIKSKIADQAVKPKTPVKPMKKEEEETGTQNAPVETAKPAEPEKPAVKAPKTKKAAEPKTETPEPAKPAEPAPEAPAMPIVLTPGSKTGYKVAGVQEKPLNKIIAEWSEALGNGKVSKEKFDAMANACEAIADNRSVMQFIVKYRKVE